MCQALERRGIPFQVVDVPPFYMQPQLRGAYYWLRVAAGYGDNGEHLALLQHIKGLGAATIKLLEDELLFSNLNFFDAVAKLKLSPKIRGIISELHVFIGLFRNKVQKQGMAAALLEVFDWLAISTEPEAAQRLLDLAGSFGSDLSGFSEYLKRNSQATVYDDTAEAVSLMTIHAAKGLEFPLVFITGVEEDIIPCLILAERGKEEDLPESIVAEERRLFYVGMTRAKEHLILTAAATRSLFGVRRQQSLSRFINEIPPHLLKKAKQQARKRKKRPSAVQMKLF